MSRKQRVRRRLLMAGGSAAALAAVKGLPSLAQVPPPAAVRPRLPPRQFVPIRQLQPRLQIPPLPISRMTGALGSTGAWGDVQVRELPSGLVPVFVRTHNKQGVLDLTRRRSVVSLANGAVVLTAQGIQIGREVQPWNRASISGLISRARTDAAFRTSLLELRAALVTAYPHAIATSKQKGDARSAGGVMQMARGMGTGVAPNKSGCTTTTVTEPVIRTIKEAQEVWRSVEEQFSACVDAQMRNNILGGEAAAVIYCSALSLVPIFLGVVTVLRHFADEVTRTLVTCSIELNHRLLDIYRGIEAPISRGIDLRPGVIGAAAAITPGDIAAAIERIRAVMNGIGPFTDCMLQGQWSFAAADLSVITGDKLEIPYGVKVCIPAECARRLRLENVGQNLQEAATALVSLLAAVNEEFDKIAAELGIPPAAEFKAIADALGEKGVTALILVAGLLLFLTYYASMIAIQLQLLPADALADGMVCIEHPTFVVAAVTVLLPGPGSISHYIPPIVTG